MKISNLFKAYTMLLAAMTIAALLLVVGNADRAGAAFPGKNGKIVFERVDARTETSGIFTMRPDGTGLASTGVRFAGSPAWSPDGKKIAFHADLRSGFDIYVMKADGSGMRRITRGWDNDFAPSWSPDGKRIAFIKESSTAGGAEIYTIRLDGTRLSKLTDTRAFEVDGVAWSPDGEKIAFARQGRTNNVDIFTMNADGSGQRSLTQTPRVNEGDADWSPDGKKIAFSRFTRASEEVYVMNANGSRRKNLTAGAADGFSPAFSPDGKKIAFARSRVGESRIFVMNADGTRAKRLTTGPTSDFAPDWQPRSSTRTTAGAVSGISVDALLHTIRHRLGLNDLGERIRTSVDRALASDER